MQRHLTLALEVGYQTSEQPISATMVETVFSTNSTTWSQP